MSTAKGQVSPFYQPQTMSGRPPPRHGGKKSSSTAPGNSTLHSRNQSPQIRRSRSPGANFSRVKRTQTGSPMGRSPLDRGTFSMSAGRTVAEQKKRPQSAQPERPRFSLGDRGSFRWEEIPLLPDGKSRLFKSKRVQEDEQDHETSIFSYRASLGGFGMKPDKLASAEDPGECGMSDAESDAGSIFSETEGVRRSRQQQDSEFRALLPGHEHNGNPREKSHLKRLLTSADNLFPVRSSLKSLGVERLNELVYGEVDPSKLMSTLSADIYTGLWSCCRKTNPNAPGCSVGEHSSSMFLCSRCGVLFDTSTNRGRQECSYHPGAINRSKAGGVWWTCCGAVGFKNSLLHSSGGDLHGAQNRRWGCKRDKDHIALTMFDPSTDSRKYTHTTIDEVVKHDALGPQLEAPNFYDDSAWVGNGDRVACNRIAAMTCVGQPLMPIVLGIQLHYEDVATLELTDGDRYVGNPGPISGRDHLRKIREDKLIFDIDEYMVRIDFDYNERHIQTLSVVTSTGRHHTFFEKWKKDSDEKSLKEMQAHDEVESKMAQLRAPDGHRIVGLRYGIGENLRCLGIMTQRLLAYDEKAKALTLTLGRCTLCAGYFVASVNENTVGDTESQGSNELGRKTESKMKSILENTCRFHSGWWTPQRRVRLADDSTLRKCSAICEANNCGKGCVRYEHRSHVMVHSCGDKRCSEICDMDGCMRRCSVLDHFHGTNDPMAIHTCGGAHPCKTPCVCGRKCKFVAAKGEAVHTWHWCGSSEGCNKKCSVSGCESRCNHPDHHHHLQEDCVHLCGNDHPCLELCSAEGCTAKCRLDRQKVHKHACHNPHRLGCRSRCSVFDCVEICANPDHFHADYATYHKCNEDHPCRRLCDAPGCKSPCALSREHPHDRHECANFDKLRCAETCGIEGCNRPCANIDHFHGCDLVEIDGKTVPRKPHLCAGRHVCGQKCTAVGCQASCTVDKAVIGHRCTCEGIAGCRMPCYFSNKSQNCRNFCSSEDHFHDEEYHLCTKDHECQALCGTPEPCLWEGGIKKRQKKRCAIVIPAGQIKHEGPHDCCSKHARPVQFSTKDKEGIQCTARCDKSGCRRRCRFKPSPDDHPLLADGEWMHICEEVMCLDLCPYPKCKSICNLDHDHTVTNESSQCGCCPLHRTFVPDKKIVGENGELADISSTSAARATKMLAQMKIASEIGNLKATEGGQARRLHTKRASAETVVAIDDPPQGAAAKPYYHGFGVNVEKYGQHFKLYSGMAPLERDGAAREGIPGSAEIRPLIKFQKQFPKAARSAAVDEDQEDEMLD